MSKFKNIISGYNAFVKYHDDMFNEGVKIIDFPFKDLFIDFRFFNGLRLDVVDAHIENLKQVMMDIANDQAELQREEELKRLSVANEKSKEGQ